MVRRTRPGISRFRVRSPSTKLMLASILSLGSRPGMTGTLVAREAGKFLHHALIDRPLERHDQFREILHRLPAPADEFGLVAAAGARDIDLGIRAGEADRKPFLTLAAIAALPSAPRHGARNVVDHPVGDFAEFLDRSNAGFLVKLAFR